MYLALLDWALSTCQTFSLVWRKGFSFNRKAKEIEKKLKPFLISEKITNEWPGTTILAPSEDTVRYYNITPDSVEVLKKPKRVYAWLASDYPEDLTFYKPDKTPWFVSVAHENISYFENPDFPIEEAERKIPKIKLSEKEIEENS